MNNITKTPVNSTCVFCSVSTHNVAFYDVDQIKITLCDTCFSKLEPMLLKEPLRDNDDLKVLLRKLVVDGYVLESDPCSFEPPEKVLFEASFMVWGFLQ